MNVLKTVDELRILRKSVSEKGLTIGFVPTMGYLHRGHLELVQRAVNECDVPVTSIFVNPTQFSPDEDFEDYPRDMDRDLELLESVGCFNAFCPEVEEVYPGGFCTAVTVEKLSGKLCGRYRPGHFRGVVTVVAKLLLMLLPDKAYFGEKDAQQLIIIRRMVKDLNIPCEIVGVPTVREPDGLAMSSRNLYLSPEERKAAPVLYRALISAKNMIDSGERNTTKILAMARKVIETEPLVRLQYLEAVDREKLEPLEILKGEVLIALAAYLGRARLIDNIMLDLEA
ncbi:MAG: pantoate--beta-alanine ligase [Candidatus Eremiobacteraeota bacterium]|nr:pantoate--beta-alanine ligase [Candidatus Eremiobacteraeota bacterium]